MKRRNKLKEFAEGKGIHNANHFSVVSGIPRETVYFLWEGDKDMSVETLRSIYQSFPDIDVEDLICLEVEKQGEKHATQ